MSIAMYGGSFDPIHNGHIALCRAALEESRADRLLLVPTGESPHRDNTGKTPFAHRLALCQIAAREIPRAEASDLEQRLGGVNYTIRTVLALKEQYPDQPLFLIVGGDMLLCFHRWKDYRAILENVTLLAGARTGDQRRELEEYCRRVLPDYPQVRLVDFSPIEISSTRLRELASKGEDLSPWVPAGVAEYIHNHGLYQTKEAVEQ